MKYLLQSGLVCMVLISASVHGQSVSSKIDAVVIYGTGATVTRTAEVAVMPGDNQVQFTGLSTQIDPGSFQLEVIGDGVRPGQIRFDEVQQTDAYSAQVQALQRAIDEHQVIVSAIADAIETARLELKFLEGIAAGYAKESWGVAARGQADVSSWRSALQVLAEGSDSARSTIREKGHEKREADKELSRLQRELDATRGRRAESLTVSVVLRAELASTVQVKLHYFMGEAYWSPRYEARLDSEEGTLKLLQKAVVAQTTDEHWPNARLTLSTSQPSAELMPPDVGSEFVDLFDMPPPAPRFAQRIAMESQAAAGSMVKKSDVTGSPVQRNLGAYAVSYVVPGRVSVANDADEDQVFDLQRFQFEPELITRVVPRSSSAAFLTAKLTYDEPTPLYGNQMVVYVDGVYVGESVLPTVLPGAEITLPMGQDRRVEVLVRDQGGQKGKGGFIGRRKTEQIEMLFEISNHRGALTHVEVIDRYPVAVNEDVEVEIFREASTPDEKDLHDKPGVILWRKDLQPGETWRITHAYEVSYPADKQIIRRNG